MTDAATILRSACANAAAIVLTWPEGEAVGLHYDAIIDAATLLAEIEQTPGFEWGDVGCPVWEYTTATIGEGLTATPALSPEEAVVAALRINTAEG